MTDVVTDLMYETDVMLMMFPIVFALIAMFCTGIGCNVLIRRKPLIISSEWSIGFLVVLLAPAMIDSVAAFLERIKENAASFRDVFMILCAGMGDVWFILLFFLLFFISWVFLVIGTREYTFIGVSEETIRGAIYYGLQKLGIPYKETRAWIKLPELNTKIQINMRYWGSKGEIKIKDRSQKAFLRKLVKQMRIYFRDQKVPTKKIAAIEYLIVGIFCTVFALSEILPKGWIDIF